MRPCCLMLHKQLFTVLPTNSYLYSKFRKFSKKASVAEFFFYQAIYAAWTQPKKNKSMWNDTSQHSEAVARRFSVKEVFLETLQNLQEKIPASWGLQLH